ncbi:Uncharacterised protein [Acinetobacter baumannii]|nr:Uncharacterised protein [Acinetobacter baumannii]
MTGETEKGISIMVVKTALPLNWNLETAHAAATPKITLIGTAIAAVNSVSFTADNVSGSIKA